MGNPPAVFLRKVRVRPVHNIAEQRRWDRLVAKHHYLSFRGFYGKALRHVAMIEDTWLVLVGWQAGAFKVGVRDAWIGWSREQQYSRLHLIANNSRFLILDAGRVPNMASRVLGLSLRRLSADMESLHGYPVLLAETFVDGSRFSGTCYRAANWQALGSTKGFSRRPGSPMWWSRNGQPKEVFVYDISGNGAERLRSMNPADNCEREEKKAPPSPKDLRSLYFRFEEREDFRKPRGQRYSLACYLTIAVAARMAGYRGVGAFADFASYLDDEQREAVGAFRSKTRRCRTVPTESTFRYILSNLPPETLEKAVRSWTADATRQTPIAMDGKQIRGASRQIEGKGLMTVAAVEHGSGLVIGQTQVPDKTNEITAVRQLVQELDIRGRIVTLDALHVQQETARIVVDQANADYVVTATKKNQKTIAEDLQSIDFSTQGRETCETVDKGHGRLEERRCTVVDLTGPEWSDYCKLHGRRQAMRIDRKIENLKSGKTTEETAYCLTSLAPDKAGAKELLALVRHHWQIETRLHYVRDFTYDEDRCRVRVRHTPRNLACLTNIAISIVRLQGRFQYLPGANRYYQNHRQKALDAVLSPLNRS